MDYVKVQKRIAYEGVLAEAAQTSHETTLKLLTLQSLCSFGPLSLDALAD